MKPTAYYNEIEPYAADWIRNLMAAGHIMAGEVDTRSIKDVQPDDLRGFTRHHFFAGVAVWDYALSLAGWPPERPVFTGSCPCQPFSAAGKGKGHEDERHLWPAWQRLIGECRPAVVFGEQVASADGLGWLDVVLSDLEAADYAVAAADLSAAGFGAPHIRQRLFFVAHAASVGQWREAREFGGLRPAGRLQAGLMADDDSAGLGEQRIARLLDRKWPAQRHDADGCGEAGLVADADGRLTSEASDGRLAGLQRGGEHGLLAPSGRAGVLGNANGASAARLGEHGGQSAASSWIRGGPGDTGRMGDTSDQGSQGRVAAGERPDAQRPPAERAGQAGELVDAADRRLEARTEPGTRGETEGPRAWTPAVDERRGTGFWDACDWIPCRDGKARPVEPGTFPLASRHPSGVGLLRAGQEPDAPVPREDQGSRVGRLRAYGNSIVAPVAAGFIAAAMPDLQP